MNHNFIENELIILTKQTLDIFLKQDNPGELIALYAFYYYTAKWQGTNQARCTTSYAANGLHWAESKIRRVKKQLIEFGLIEDVQAKDESGKICGHYIKMNYVFKKETVATILNENHTMENPQGGESHRVDNQEGNALSPNTSNACSSIKEKKKVSKNSFDAIIDAYLSPDGQSVRFQDHEKRRELLQEWLKVRKAKRSAMTDRAIQMNIDKLDKLAAESGMSVVDYLSEVICRGWAAFYAIKNYNAPQKTYGANGIPIDNTPSDLGDIFK